LHRADGGASLAKSIAHARRRPEDDFFEVGGDSLKAITFMLGPRRPGLELSLTLIIEAPNFADFARP